MKNYWHIYSPLSKILIIWGMLLSTLMFFGIMSSAHIGSLMWGPVRDFWSMSIAISDIKYGLKGGLGYRVVSNELAKYLTPSGEDLDVSQRTKELVDNPHNVTKALTAAIAIPPETIHSGPIDSGMYITTAYDDFGYATFHKYAFQLFGFNAFSTHYLYFLILFTSLILFIITFYKYDLGIIILIFSITSLFLVSASPLIFDEQMPNFAASRFLGTLALFPMLHLLVFALRSSRPRKIDLICLIMQIILFGFTVRLRSSALWIVIGFFMTVFFMVIYQIYNSYKDKNKLLVSFLRVIKVSRIVKIFAMIVISLMTFNLIEKLSLNKIYFSDDLSTSHLFWHNVYMGLTFHPQWKDKVPYPEQATVMGDMVPFTLYEIYFKNIPPQSRYSAITKLQKIKIYEKIVRKEFFTFAYQNPKYMAELFFYYKPFYIFKGLKDVFLSLSSKVWLIAVLSIFGVLLLLEQLRVTQREKLIVIIVSATFFIASLLPELFTYPISFLLSDPFFTSLVLFMTLFTFILSFIVQKIKVLQLSLFSKILSITTKA